MRKTNQIIPDFTEDIVGFMVQSILTITRFPEAPFALIPLSKMDEVKYGADVIVDSIRPLYIQFKRSCSYPDNSTSSIIKDRNKLKASCMPRVLYFELRNKQPKHKEYQHNVLFDLRSKLEATGHGTAFYTAPLFLKRTPYLEAVHTSSLKTVNSGHKFSTEPFVQQTQDILTSSGNVNFQSVPLLQAHIVIPPHVRVTTYKHKYSYLETGKEVCFHNPTNLENQSTLGRAISDFLRLKDGRPTTEMINIEKSNFLLNTLMNELLSETHIEEDKNIMGKWRISEKN